MTFEQSVEIAARALAGVKDRFGDPDRLHTMRVVVAEGEAGRLARVVKLADLRDKLGRVGPGMEELRNRYEKAIKGLESVS